MEKLHTAVHASPSAAERLDFVLSGPLTSDQQAFPSLSSPSSVSVPSYPSYAEDGRFLQQLNAEPAVQAPVHPPGFSSESWKVAYLKSMSYYILPVFIGLLVAVLLLPLFLLLFCLRNRKSSRR